MFSGGNKIKLEKDLIERIKRVSEVAGYASHEEFIVHVLEKELANFEDAESDEDITEITPLTGIFMTDSEEETAFGETITFECTDEDKVPNEVGLAEIEVRCLLGGSFEVPQWPGMSILVKVSEQLFLLIFGLRGPRVRLHL